MSELDLAAAVAAARRQADTVTGDAAATRRRIRDSLERRRNGRARRFTLVGVVAATLFGSTAFAYYSAPWRRDALTAPVVVPAPSTTTARDIDSPRVRERAIVAERPDMKIEAPPFAPIVSPVVETPVVEAPRVEAPRVQTSQVKASHVEAPPRQDIVAPPRGEAAHVEAAPRDPELAAYQIAYDAHFHGASPEAALAAWDAYLAAYPTGKLAIDARYNRAIMLVKLKRWADARDALRPLANAPEGAYRRAEAARLMSALPH